MKTTHKPDLDRILTFHRREVMVLAQGMLLHNGSSPVGPSTTLGVFIDQGNHTFWTEYNSLMIKLLNRITPASSLDLGDNLPAARQEEIYLDVMLPALKEAIGHHRIVDLALDDRSPDGFYGCMRAVMNELLYTSDTLHKSVDPESGKEIVIGFKEWDIGLVHNLRGVHVTAMLLDDNDRPLAIADLSTVLADVKDTTYPTFLENLGEESAFFDDFATSLHSQHPYADRNWFKEGRGIVYLHNWQRHPVHTRPGTGARILKAALSALRKHDPDQAYSTLFVESQGYQYNWWYDPAEIPDWVRQTENRVSAKLHEHCWKHHFNHCLGDGVTLRALNVIHDIGINLINGEPLDGDATVRNYKRTSQETPVLH